MDWGVVLLVIIVMMMFLYLGTSCSSKNQITQDTLHNYPHMDDCPWTVGEFDQAWVNRASKKMNMRPVDFLHKLTMEKFTESQIEGFKKDYVVFRNNN